MDIHVTNKTNKSWEVVYVVFVRLVEDGTNIKNVVCCVVK